jgi:serine/threonine protein kinase
MTGQTSSHYRMTEKLGEGGMGVVYKAEDTKLKRTVALKFLAAHLLNDEETKARFQREAEAAAALTHSNIAVIYDIDESDGQSFIAMEFVEGLTVSKKVAERPLKLDEALDIAMQATLGLQAAHERGVVYRDIKSANLMVTSQGQVKIMDFGLAQLAERSKLTETTAILGTPSYMSPEQAVGDKTDRRTDIWSLGVVLYEMVTGRLPFAGERQEAVLCGITDGEPEPVTALPAGLPMEVEWIIGKALAKD